MAKEFDIIIFGATGFTGGLVASYFAPIKQCANLKMNASSNNDKRNEPKSLLYKT